MFDKPAAIVITAGRDTLQKKHATYKSLYFDKKYLETNYPCKKIYISEIHNCTHNMSIYPCNYASLGSSR